MIKIVSAIIFQRCQNCSWYRSKATRGIWKNNFQENKTLLNENFCMDFMGCDYCIFLVVNWLFVHRRHRGIPWRMSLFQLYLWRSIITCRMLYTGISNYDCNHLGKLDSSNDILRIVKLWRIWRKIEADVWFNQEHHYSTHGSGGHYFWTHQL